MELTVSLLERREANAAMPEIVGASCDLRSGVRLAFLTR